MVTKISLEEYERIQAIRSFYKSSTKKRMKNRKYAFVIKKCAFCNKFLEKGKIKYCNLSCKEKAKILRYGRRIKNKKINLNDSSIKYKIPKRISKDIVKLYGHLISDGHISNGIGVYSLGYCNKEIILINDVKRIILKHFKKEGNLYKNKNECYSYTIVSKVIWNYFKFFDRNKILNCKSEKIKSSFLQACFDDEGHVSKRGYISISQKDKKYIEDIKKLLCDLGIKKTKEYEIYNKTYHKVYYCLRISCKDNYLFKERVGFLHPKKDKRLNNYLIRIEKWNNRERHNSLEYSRKWRKNNKEKIKGYYTKNKEYYKNYSKEYSRNNQEKVLDSTRNWQRKNREKCRASCKRYYERHKKKT